MTKIASDAMVIQLAVDMAGDGEVQERLARLNDFMQTINAKSKATAQSVDMERMSVEGKYNPDIQRDLEIEKAIQLTNKLNLSLETQDAILAEIEQKHRNAVNLQSQQYSQQDMPGDDMAAAFRKNQQEIVTAEQEALAARKRAAKETEQLENDQLTSRERMFKKLAEVNRQLLGGEIDSRGARLRSDAAKKEYADTVANEAKIAAAKKAAADKQLAQEQADIDKRTAAFHKEYRDRVEAIKAQKQAFADAAIDATQRKAAAAINATELADKQANAERQKAINILHSLEDATQRYARVTDELRAHLDAGDITNEQYAQGLANIERRQRSMAGGANNMAYAIGNTVTGLEDFVTVLSITGFGMDGFAAATRAASNNVGQAVRSLGTAQAAVLAPLVSIGMVLAGSAIPAIYSYITGAEDAEKATRKWEESLKALIRVARLATDEVALGMERDATRRDVAGMTDSSAIMDRMKDDVDKIAKLMNEIKGNEAELKAAAQGILNKVFDGATDDSFNKVIDALSTAGTQNLQDAADLNDKWQKDYDKIQSDFLENAPLMGGEAARATMEAQMRVLQEEMQSVFESLSSAQQNAVLDASNEMGASGYRMLGSNQFLNLFPQFDSLLNDAAIIDKIVALNEELAKISKEDTLENVKKRQELESYKLELEQLQDQREKALEAEAVKAAEIQAQAQHIDQQNMEMELEKLKIQQHKNSLLGEENEAERKLFDLALRRREIMESGIAAPDVLEGLFNMELEAMAAELEKQIAKAEEVIHSTAAMSEPQAYTSANRQIMEAAGKSADEKLQEQVDLLKAIRDHLAGTATLNVEVM